MAYNQILKALTWVSIALSLYTRPLLAGANPTMPEGLSERQFQKVIDRLEKIYSHAILTITRKTPSFAANWSSQTYNAFAHQQGTQAIISINGGIARHPGMSEDGFALVVCHEIGHHIGGIPQKSRAFTSWSSVEGQADFWAMTACMDAYLQDPVTQNVPPETDFGPFADLCRGSQLCKRKMAIAAVVTSYLQESNHEAQNLSPSESIATKTIESLPENTCRLATFIAGALCDAQSPEMKVYCERPRCWYSEPEELQGL